MAFQKAEGKEASARPRKMGGFRRRRKVCVFCSEKAKPIDYKDVATLKKYISESDQAGSPPGTSPVFSGVIDCKRAHCKEASKQINQGPDKASKDAESGLFACTRSNSVQKKWLIGQNRERQTGYQTYLL